MTVVFAADTAPTDVQCRLIRRDLIGPATLTKRGIENHDGSPITIDHDIKGNKRSATHPTAGPFETIAATNSIIIKAGADLASASTGPAGERDWWRQHRGQ